MEAVVEGAAGLHRVLHGDLHGVQVPPQHGAADGGGEADQVVQASVNRSDIHCCNIRISDDQDKIMPTNKLWLKLC